MTIEERAQEYAVIAKIRGDMPLELAEDVYIEIATEQKAIDIEKACEWLYDWNRKQAKMYGAKANLSVAEFTINVTDFRKAMED